MTEEFNVGENGGKVDPTKMFDSIDETYQRTELMFRGIYDDLVQELEMVVNNKRKISLEDGGPPKKKKKRKNFSKDSRKVLKKWLFQHKDNPYPTKEEKLELSRQSNLCTKQINTWFSNGRQRYLGKKSNSPVSKKRKRKKEPNSINNMMDDIDDEDFLDDDEGEG